MGANPVTWWELQVPDLEQAQAFYGAVFGWAFQPYGETFLAAQSPDGTMVGGLDKRPGDVAGRQVRIYLTVDDLEGTLAKVERYGGSIVASRKEIGGDMGWFAYFADPSGLVLGVVTDNPTAA